MHGFSDSIKEPPMQLCSLKAALFYMNYDIDNQKSIGFPANVINPGLISWAAVLGRVPTVPRISVVL